MNHRYEMLASSCTQENWLARHSVAISARRGLQGAPDQGRRVSVPVDSARLLQSSCMLSRQFAVIIFSTPAGGTSPGLCRPLFLPGRPAVPDGSRGASQENCRL